MPLQVTYDAPLEEAIAQICRLLQGKYPFTKREVALLLLQGDAEIQAEVVAVEDCGSYELIQEIVRQTQAGYHRPLNFVIAQLRHQAAAGLAADVVGQVVTSPGRSLADWVGWLTMWPVTGLPILAIVLYFGLYQFVGVFGAGTVVDFLEGTIFAGYINPWVNTVVQAYLPWPALQSLIAGEYGVITLGVRYAVALILPIVGSFFLVFSLIEDSGYLPRLAMLVDWLFKRIGLNGRAVIPMTLGFGCDTMATMVSRTLETRREKLIATLLLALAIPCSAQLGVILAILSGRPAALALWAAFLFLVFLLVGYLSSRILPGSRSSFYLELSPLRLPQWRNVLAKTLIRMQWYFIEVFPLFILASLLLWAGEITGAFGVITGWLTPVVEWIGLPGETARVFLFGFFRRDYGAAGLYDIAGTLSGQQLVVAAATLTLFVPCIAQFSMMLKERGWKATVAIVAFIFPFAFVAGYGLNQILTWLGVGL